MVPVLLGLAACTPDDPVAPGTDGPEGEPEEDAMTCPDTYAYQLREGVEGPDGAAAPTTGSGGRLSLTANVVDHTAPPPAANIASQTSTHSDPARRHPVFTGQR